MKGEYSDAKVNNNTFCSNAITGGLWNIFIDEWVKIIVACKKYEVVNNHIVTGSKREATKMVLIGIGLAGLAGAEARRRRKMKDVGNKAR